MFFLEDVQDELKTAFENDGLKFKWFKLKNKLMGVVKEEETSTMVAWLVVAGKSLIKMEYMKSLDERECNQVHLTHNKIYKFDWSNLLSI